MSGAVGLVVKAAVEVEFEVEIEVDVEFSVDCGCVFSVALPFLAADSLPRGIIAIMPFPSR